VCLSYGSERCGFCSFKQGVQNGYDYQEQKNKDLSPIIIRKECTRQGVGLFTDACTIHSQEAFDAHGARTIKKMESQLQHQLSIYIYIYCQKARTISIRRKK
jgi:3-deoxy-D-arabino-heptulosonate 7-phosphate (DAHP) synthase